MQNANLELYYEDYVNDFTYKGTLSNLDTVDLNVYYYNDSNGTFSKSLWILVTPTSSNAYVSIYYQILQITQTTNTTQTPKTNESSDPLSESEIKAILCSSFFGS